MKKFFKRLLGASVVIGVLIASQASAALFSTNVTAGGVYLLSTNRMQIYSFQVNADKAVVAELYDCASLAAPFYGTNYTNAAWTSNTSWETNYVTSNIGVTGYTNWFTNNGLWTVTITNAANTNALSPQVVASAAANTFTIIDTDALFVHGVVLKTTTNASIIINYRSGQ